MSHEHYDDLAMSDMDEEEMPFEASTTAEARTGNFSITDVEHFPVFDPLLATTITDSQQSCSHCMMHSQSGANSSAPVVPNNSGAHGIVAAAPGIAWASVASPLTLVDIHDHGPPGLNSSRYILNSSFRI